MKKLLDVLTNRGLTKAGRRMPLRQATELRVGAVAWATVRRGNNKWQSDNVNEQIREYIARESGFIMTTSDVNYVLNWVVDKKLGWTTASEKNSRRFKEFGFYGEVDLTGFSKPPPGLSPNAETLQKLAEEVREDVSKEEVVKMDVQVDDMPLPGYEPPPPPVYRLDELMELLKKWAENDADSYARYVDNAIERLEHSG